MLETAFRKGCYLDGWSELFDYEKWVEAFSECGLDMGFYAFRTREKNEVLPWDHIDCGITKAFLWREKEKGDRAEVTPDCRNGCNGCGIQRFEGVCQYAHVHRV